MNKRMVLVVVGIGLVVGASAWAQYPNMLSVRALMTDEEFQGAGLTKLSEIELAELDRWLDKWARNIVQIAKNPDHRAPAHSPVNTSSLAELEGSVVVANDGQPLGLITSNCFKSDALCNEFGKYGNEYNSHSMLNEFGQYGGEFSAKSPFNEFTSTPPRIFKRGSFIAYLTSNSALHPRVDPFWLLGALKTR